MPTAEERTHIAEESQQHIGSQVGIEPMPHRASFNQRRTLTAAENGMVYSCSQQQQDLESFVIQLQTQNGRLIEELDRKELEIRNLSKARETLGRLQAEVLSSV